MNGKAIVICGGSGYVGSAVVKRLAAQGHRVVFSYFRNADRAETMRAALAGVEPVRVDLTEAGAARAFVERAAARLGRIDALVHCAADAGDDFLFARGRPDDTEGFLSLKSADVDQMTSIGIRSVIEAMQGATPALMAQGEGHVVVMSSLKSLKAIPAPAPYAAVKGAMHSLVESMAKTLGKHKVLVNAVAPGLLDGGVSRKLRADVVKTYLEHCPIGRLGTADEVAELVTWLVEENTYVTGQTLLMDGGM